MIYAIIGGNGSGKTLRAITRGVELVGKGREVFALGIRDLNEAASGIKRWEPRDLEDWKQLPTGAVLIVDEVQDYLPVRAAQEAPTEWIKDLAKHRHLGLDFIWTTPDLRMVDAFARRLVVETELIRRYEGGFNASRIFRSSTSIEDPKRDRALKDAEWEVWRYPHQNFALYKSADEHTTPKRIPQQLRALAVALVVVFVGIGGAAWALTGMLAADDQERAEEVQRVAVQPAIAFADPGIRAEVQQATLRQTDPFAYLRPRIPGAPWTAPAYDDVAIGDPPQLACMASTKSCTCITVDQGTLWLLDEDLCRLTARYGRYDPTRRDAPGQGRGFGGGAVQAPAQAAGQVNSARIVPATNGS